MREDQFAESFWSAERKDFRLLDSNWRVVHDTDEIRYLSETRCVTFPNGHSETTVGQVENFDDALKFLSVRGLMKDDLAVCG